jgi:hypothetical protein
VIAGHAPHSPHERQRKEDQLHYGYLDVLLASGCVDLCNTPLPRIIDTGIRHHDLLRLLNAYQVVIYPDLHPVAPQSLLYIEAEVMEPNVTILPDGAR